MAPVGPPARARSARGPCPAGRTVEIVQAHGPISRTVRPSVALCSVSPGEAMLATPMGGRQHGPGLTRTPLLRGRARFAGIVLAGLAVATVPAHVSAKPPGHTQRLGGVEPQGAATPAVTGLHYNPALLAAMRGTAVHGSVGFGLMQHRIRRNMIEGTTGAPTEELVRPTNLLHPTMGYFAGASFYFDPWAIGAGIYDVGSSYRLASADPVRFHLAPDPDVGCLRIGKNACPPNGGAVSYQHDVTIAAAWNGGPFQIGAAAHFPMVRERFTFDNDTELTPNDQALTVRCVSKEDPACAERVGFKGWTHWIGRDGIPAGFDAAVSLGVSFSLRDGRLTLGARYRTAPLRRGGEVILGGVSLVCRPNPDDNEATPDLVPACTQAEPTTATMRQRLPQQLALGVSALLGRARLWRLDLNAQWVDLCAGGIAPGRCPDGGGQRLRLVGLDRQSFVLPEFSRYRGLSDVYSLDAFVRRRLRNNSSLVFGSHVASPSTRRGADTADAATGAQLGASFGFRFRIPRTEVLLVPGYALDFSLPRIVTPAQARFDPEAATAFEINGADLNSPGAQAVLLGQGRSTNAGTYFAMAHGLSLALMWGERSAQLDWRLD